MIRLLGVSPKFIYFNLLSHRFIQSVNKLAKGTSYPAVTNSVVLGQKIPIPPLPEQHRIVEKIEELFSDLDNGIDNLELAQNQLKMYRQALLKHAFEGKLTEEWRKKNKPEPAEQLLERIKEERQKRYEEEVAEWQVAVKAWEKEGKIGKKPRKPKIFKKHSSQFDKGFLGMIKIPDNWLLSKLGVIVNEVVVGYVGPVTKHLTENKKEGVRFLSTTHIGENEFLNKDFRYVTKDFSSGNIKSKVKGGDIIVARHGDSGKSCILPNRVVEA